MSFVDRLIAVAKIEVGHQEEPRGSNWGPQVKKYLEAAGFNSPAPWCVAFVVWAVKQIGGTIMTTASSGALLQWARHNQLTVPKPEIGCVFILQKADGAAFHAGIVTDVGTLYYSTIEGNSNAVGSPGGYKVCARKRLRFGRKQTFVNLAGLETNT